MTDKKSTSQVRAAFLAFFSRQDHNVVASSSLVPVNDATLLFTNAGMVPFKEVFLGQEKRSYVRATSSQPCVRAGGKHNDLENVGYTARHHTFFEMLGNFSFGDYFKRDAIQYAWDFLTKEMAIPSERLWVTVFDEDDEAAEIWLNEIGVSADRLVRIGAKDNFWSMGDTGPCGPCTEIFYDHGSEIAGGPPGSPDEDGDRYVEIWNLVFMQYNRESDGTLVPLPKPSVDTGMGLERIAAVMQGVSSNYDIDLFRNLIAVIAAIAGMNDLKNNSLRVIADHIRSCAFLITDGVLPSNEGRGYVLRRIIRRAIRHGHKLGLHEAFFHKLVQPLVDEMGQAYAELAQAQAQVERVLKQEEVRFAETLDQGMHILEQAISALSGKTIPGDTVFKLYDTYGFPVDLTADIARERDLQIDMDGFERDMEAQRERARAAGQFGADYNKRIEVEGGTEFTGYEHLQGQSVVKGLFVGSDVVTALQEGDEGVVVLDRTPFYAESGGQAGDSGQLVVGQAVFEVQDTKKQPNGAFMHIGRMVSGTLNASDTVNGQVNDANRQATELNHSATHLLHAALREGLGEHVAQKGSLVDAERLRFDFSHFEAMTAEQISAIEQRVNQQIRANNAVQTNLMDYDKALETGAMALFGEKYDEQVRVLRMGDFSIELCGGTHVSHTGNIGLFKIVSEAGIASGVRRIEAVTGQRALDHVASTEQCLLSISVMLKSGGENIDKRVQQLLDQNKQYEKELEQLKSKLASSAGSDLAEQASEINGVKLLAARLDDVDPKSLRDTLDQLKNKLGEAVLVLATVSEGKVSLIAGVTKATTSLVKAGELVNFVAGQVGGKGGGRPDMAQAGGTNPEGLDNALASVQQWVEDKIRT